MKAPEMQRAVSDSSIPGMSTSKGKVWMKWTRRLIEFKWVLVQDGSALELYYECNENLLKGIKQKNVII